MIVTGGAEVGGPHTQGVYSHTNGYKIDLEDSLKVNNYIENKYERIGTRGDGAPLYVDTKGNTYARESSHWDVCYQCSPS